MIARTVEQLYQTDQEIEALEDQLYSYIDETGQIIDSEGVESLIQSLETKAKDKEKFLLGVAKSYAIRKARLAAINDRIKTLESTKKAIDKSVNFYGEILKRFIADDTKRLTDGEVTVEAGWRKRVAVDHRINLPSAFLKPKFVDNPMVQDTAKIEKALKQGIDVAGCYLENVRTVSVK